MKYVSLGLITFAWKLFATCQIRSFVILFKSHIIGSFPTLTGSVKDRPSVDHVQQFHLLVAGEFQMESDMNGIGTGRNRIKMTIGRGDLGAKYECRAHNDALEAPLVSWVEVDVNGEWFIRIS